MKTNLVEYVGTFFLVLVFGLTVAAPATGSGALAAVRSKIAGPDKH